MMEAQSKVSLQANLTPQKSQIVVFGFLILGALLCAVGFLFIYSVVELWYVPTLIGSAMIAFAAFAWFKSQKDTDLNGSPTKIKLDENSTSLVVGSRFTNSKEGVQFLTEYLSVVLNRQPLPQPDGLIDSSGMPIEGTAKEAECKVDTINIQAQYIANNVSQTTGIPPCNDSGHATEGALPSDAKMPSSIAVNQSLES